MNMKKCPICKGKGEIEDTISTSREDKSRELTIHVGKLYADGQSIKDIQTLYNWKSNRAVTYRLERYNKLMKEATDSKE